MDQCIDELWKIVCEDTKELVQLQRDGKDIEKKLELLPCLDFFKDVHIVCRCFMNYNYIIWIKFYAFIY